MVRSTKASDASHPAEMREGLGFRVPGGAGGGGGLKELELEDPIIGYFGYG